MKAKDIVEKTPVVIAKDLPKEKAEELISKFKELGCVLTLK
jgi:ribosomal protein L7/L12